MGDKDEKKWSGGGFGTFRSDNKQHSDGGGGGGGGGGGNMPPNFPTTILTGIALIAITYFMMRFDDDTGTGGGEFASREIT